MCYYDQIRWSCGYWKWGDFRQNCDKKHKAGETCGLKLVYETRTEPGECDLCQSRQRLQDRHDKLRADVERWQRDGVTDPMVKEASRLMVYLTNDLQEIQTQHERYMELPGEAERDEPVRMVLGHMARLDINATEEDESDALTSTAAKSRAGGRLHTDSSTTQTEELRAPANAGTDDERDPFWTPVPEGKLHGKEPESSSKVFENKSPEEIANYLDRHFDQVASQKDNAWVSDLRDVGYDVAEIAQIIHERLHDSPWIYFEPSHIESLPSGEWIYDRHIDDCVHQVWEGIGKIPSFTPLMMGDDQSTLRRVEELCGLGGIVPVSRNQDEWIGTVKFDHNEHLSASLSFWYSEESTSHLTKTVDRLLRVARNFDRAAKVLQQAGLCCDTFTILRAYTDSPDLTQSSSKVSALPRRTRAPELVLEEVPLRSAKDLLQGLRRLKLIMITKPTSRSQGKELSARIDPIFQEVLDLEAMGVFFGHRQNLKATKQRVRIYYDSITGEKSWLDIVHLFTVALQALCTGLLSYTQAHVGMLQPFFLDRPVKKVYLNGTDSGPNMDSRPRLVAKLLRLTCLGDMLQGPVMVFSPPPPAEVPSIEKYPVSASLGGILDTWGPGEVIFKSGKLDRPTAVRIGGGYISPASDYPGDQYHWDKRLRLPWSDPYLQLHKLIIIDGLVELNEGCNNDEDVCWNSSLSKFEELGTFSSYTETAEYQLGFQGGPENLAFMGNKVWAKRRGKTVKSKNLERRDVFLLPFLDFYWGVRVSYCTGVAQRVPLRKLVAELLPAFAKTIPSGKAKSLWAELMDSRNMVRILSNPDHEGVSIYEWFEGLPEEHSIFFLGLVRQILETLEDTGLSPCGRYFLVAWPHEGFVNRCFRIPLDECNKWALMLADSDDCATFAYMSNACLQVNGLPCRGPNPGWQNRLSMLETAVLCPASTEANWELRHEQTYFFHKLDNTLFWVKAQRDMTNQGRCVSLVRLVSIQSLPRDVMQRLLFKEGQKRQKRLREKDLANVPAEIVSVSAFRPR